MVAGAVLVVFGFIGFAFRQNRTVEPDHEPTEMKAKGEMNKRAVVASPPWTPAEDEKLRALVALGERPATIAEQLQRSEEAVRHRFYKLGIPLKTIRIAGAKGEEKTFANHPERQFMEYLRGKGWVKETALPSSRLVVSLQKKGWIEQQRQNNEALYRMTDVGLAALKAPVPIQKSWAKPQSVGELRLKAKK